MRDVIRFRREEQQPGFMGITHTAGGCQWLGRPDSKRQYPKGCLQLLEGMVRSHQSGPAPGRESKSSTLASSLPRSTLYLDDDPLIETLPSLTVVSHLTPVSTAVFSPRECRCHNPVQAGIPAAEATVQQPGVIRNPGLHPMKSGPSKWVQLRPGAGVTRS